MLKETEPEPVSTCPLCTINLYGNTVLQKTDKEGNKIALCKSEKGKPQYIIKGTPAVMPCGINRIDLGRCPFETEEQQAKLVVFQEHEKIAGLLGTMHTNE